MARGLWCHVFLIVYKSHAKQHDFIFDTSHQLNMWLMLIAAVYFDCGGCLSFCSIPSVSTLCISPPLSPLLKLDVTNSWICTFLHQNQHAPHHRLVQIWSEHTQNPPAAWWWIGILGTMLMHQASTLRQMTANWFSDKSLVWDPTDSGWIEASSVIPWGFRKPCHRKQTVTCSYSARICSYICKISPVPFITNESLQLFKQKDRKVKLPWNNRSLSTKCCVQVIFMCLGIR